MFSDNYSAPSDIPPGRSRREGQGGWSYHMEGDRNDRKL